MNPTNRRPFVAQSLAQKVKQPKQPAPAFRPIVAQVKTVPSAQSVKRPVAGPVYKPQAKPVTAQPKAGLLQRKTHPVAPIAYRPQPTPRVLQAKAAGRQPSAIGPLSPPVYPPQSLPRVLQTKKVGESGVVKPPFASSTRSNTTNTIQRSIDPTVAVAGLVVGAAVVGGLLYRRWNQQPEAREKKEPEKKEELLTKDKLVARATFLETRVKKYKDKTLLLRVQAFQEKLEKKNGFPSLEAADAQLKIIEQTVRLAEQRNPIGYGEPALKTGYKPVEKPEKKDDGKGHAEESEDDIAEPPAEAIDDVRERAIQRSRELSGHGRARHGHQVEVPDARQQVQRERDEADAADEAERLFRKTWKRDPGLRARWGYP
jgi:hypothetical protein